MKNEPKSVKIPPERMRLNIQKKIISGFLIVILLVGIVGWFGLHAGQQIAESYDGFENYETKVDAAAEASSYAKRAEGHLLLYLMLKSETDKEKFPLRHASLEEQIAILDDEVTLVEAIEQMNTLKSYTSEILEYGNQLIQLHDENPEAFNPKNHTELIRKFHDASSGARSAGVEIVDIETSNLNQNIEHAITNAEFMWKIIFIVVVITIVLSLTIGFFLAHFISKPIIKLRDAAVEIGKGKLDTKIEIKSNDEVGDLTDAFNQMTENLKKNHEQLQEKTEELEKSNKELDIKVNELEKYKEVTVGRELKMVEMKKEIDNLLKKLGEKPRYNG